MTRFAALLPAALLVAGCSDARRPVPEATFRSHGHDHGHSHERGKMLLADAGPYHAGLTAHLSPKDGHELDVFFETADGKEPKPVPLPLDRFAATARTAGGMEHVLEFAPAPPEERKGDPPGKCSHFVAKAPWLNPDEAVTVTADLPIDGKTRRVSWPDFPPRRYAHHAD